MTNAHVAFGREVVKDGIEFHPTGSIACCVRQIKEVVACSLSHDYAVLEVELPSAMREVRPVGLSSEPVRTGTECIKLATRT